MPSDRILTITLCGITHDDSWLLINRNQPPYQGHWGLVGGKMEFGETIAEAAKRETQEETGLAVAFDRVKGIVNETLVNGDSVHAHFVLFVCRLRAATRSFVTSDEGELRWFTVDEIESERDLIIPTDLRMVKTMLLRPTNDLPLVEASMREHNDRYHVLRFDAQ